MLGDGGNHRSGAAPTGGRTRPSWRHSLGPACEPYTAAIGYASQQTSSKPLRARRGWRPRGGRPVPGGTVRRASGPWSSPNVSSGASGGEPSNPMCAAPSSNRTQASRVDKCVEPPDARTGGRRGILSPARHPGTLAILRPLLLGTMLNATPTVRTPRRRRSLDKSRSPAWPRPRWERRLGARPPRALRALRLCPSGC